MCGSGPRLDGNKNRRTRRPCARGGIGSQRRLCGFLPLFSSHLPWRALPWEALFACLECVMNLRAVRLLGSIARTSLALRLLVRLVAGWRLGRG
jgi:hypothetical protein